MKAFTVFRWSFIAAIVIFSLYFLAGVKSIIAPFIGGAVLAYLLSPAVCWLERKGLHRRGAVAVILIWIVVLSALIVFMALPKLYIELGKLVTVLPDRMQVINEYLESTKRYYSQSGLPAEVNEILDGHLIKIQTFLLDWLERVVGNLPEILASIGLFILSPVLAVYFLTDWQKISDWILKLVPGRKRGQWLRLLQEIDYIIRRYIQGNIIDALIVGVLIGIGVKIIGMEYAFIIGVICGITNLIPYFGPILGGIPSVILALAVNPVMALKVAVIIIIVQQIDGNIINPRLMSNKLGLHPLWVVFAILAGGETGGLLGMFIAIPLAAVLKIILKYIYYFLVSPGELKS